MKTLFFVFFLLPVAIFSQNKSIEEAIQKLAEHQKEDVEKVNLMLQVAATYYGVDTKKLSEISKDALTLSNKLNYKKGIAESYKLQGAASISLGDFKAAESFFSQSLKLYKDIKYIPGIVICNANLGAVKLYQNQYPEALRLFQTSIKYAEKTNDYKNSAIAYSNIGIIYTELKNYDEALAQFSLALQNNIKSQNDNGIAANHSNIGTVYLNQNNNSKAREHYQLALEKNQEIGNQLGIAREYGNLASLFMKENDYAQGYEYITSALKINQEFKNKKGIAFNYQNLGEYYSHENKPDEALNYFYRALKIANEIETKDIQKDAYKSLSELYENKNSDSAYFYYKKYTEVNESIDNEDNRKQIFRLEAQYEFVSKEEKYQTQQLLDQERLKQNQLLLNINELRLSESNKARDLSNLNFLKTQSELENEQLESIAREKQLEISKKEIELKQNEIKVHQLKLSAKERQKWVYIIGLGLLFVIGALLFYQNRNRKKANKKLHVLNSELDKANKNKMFFLGILNHDLRSPVASLVHFLHLQKETTELLDKEIQNRLSQQATNSAEQLLKNMEGLLLWSKSQMEKFEVSNETFPVHKLFLELRDEFNWASDINLIFEDNDIQIHSDKEYLKTILRNLIANSIKVLDNMSNARITCKAEYSVDMVKISVRDNGGGAEIEKFKALFSDKENVGIKHGLGLHLIRDLCKAINAKIQVNTDKAIGETEILIFVKK